MDVSTREQWMTIGTAVAQPRVGRHLGQPRYELAKTFADEWAQKAFDADYESESLEHSEPVVLRVFARAKSL
jgi:hypothetical protein